jgi:hypothetical protein
MTHTHSRLVPFLAAVGLATTMALVPSSVPAQAAYSGTQRARTSAAARSQLICSGFLSIGRVRRPFPLVGAGASGFVEVVGGERVGGDARSG